MDHITQFDNWAARVNVAIVIPGFSDGESDWCIPVYLNLVRCLAAQKGMTVRVFAMRYPARRAVYPVYGATVHAIGGRYDTAGAARFRLWIRTLRTLRREHQRQPFDVIHAIWADESGLIAALAGKLLRVPSVVSIAGGELVGLRDISYGLQRGHFSRRIVSAALHLADQIIAPSQYVAALAQNQGTPERLQIHPLGVDTDLFTPESPIAFRDTSVPVTLLAVGSLTAIKDHAALLRAFANLRTPNVCLEIAGDGPLEADLRAQADVLGITDRFTLRGNIAHDALPALYRSATLHVSTSRHEAFGMVSIEAAACGVPTVGFAHGILPELAMMQAAITVAPGDEIALTAALDALLADSLRYAAMSAACRNVRERFTLAEMTKGICVAYQSAIGEQAGV